MNIKETNLLIHGDNLETMKYLLEHEYKGMIDLIYIDPPYFTQKDYYYTDKQKNQKVIAYSDKWNDLQSYLNFLRERLILMKELLSEKGSIYVQLDWRSVHYVKVMMDEIFGYKNFGNEISWRRQIPRGMKSYAKFYPFNADYILIYSKSNLAIWNKISKINKLTIAEAERKYMKDEKGFFRSSETGNYSFERLLKFYEEGRLLASQKGEIVIDKENKIIKSTKGHVRLKYYRKQKGNFIIEETPVDNIWDDIAGLGTVTSEKIGFDTQKPTALLKRVILASSNEGNLIADFFCGSGTTLAVAEKLNRRWIGVDSSDVSIEVAKKRLENANYNFIQLKEDI